MTEDRLVSTPPVNSVAELFVARTLLPMVSDRVPRFHSELPGPPPRERPLLLQPFRMPITLVPVLNTWPPLVMIKTLAMQLLSNAVVLPPI